jgi:hypothetical protein
MRYRLRTLLILLVGGSAFLAAGWYVGAASVAHSFPTGVLVVPSVLWLLIGLWPRIVEKGG